MHDDVYDNYFIAKGTKVIANIWSGCSLTFYCLLMWYLRRAITHDEEIYPDPFRFDPSRHLGGNTQPDPYKFVFGFGRRICPGIFSLYVRRRELKRVLQGPT